ncbi:hypothetical protein [Okeania sp. SIO2C2]|uniref:hypothetical protein n=2 Tax=Microcoleaceae TaxID=1892252 RepID=UPI00257F8D49|nr:hypothetical protein [Okeania sp. SIO2C2]
MKTRPRGVGQVLLSECRNCVGIVQQIYLIMLNKVVKQLSVATATVGLVTLGATFAHIQTANAAAIRSGFNSNTAVRPYKSNL